MDRPIFMSLKPRYLTKSRYLAGLQCPKRLWLQCFEPMPHEPPAPGSVQDVGIRVGQAAHRLFPGGVLVEPPPWEHEAAVERTRVSMADKTVPAVFEAAFEAEGVRIRVDVLERLSRNRWGLREVKASTAVKPEHVPDVAIQAYILAQSGVSVSSVQLVHVDTEYVRGAGEIDWGNFFTRADMTDEVRGAAEDIPSILDDLTAVIKRKRMPNVEPSSHCHTPYGCEFWDRCTVDKPEDWVFYLPRVGKKFEKLTELGIDSIAAIPDDFTLTSNQSIIRDAVRSNIAYVSDRLTDALKDTGPPAAYLDFETMNPALPLYAGTRPYQRQPFQWSLHAVDGDGGLAHYEFLADGRADPRRDFAESLIDAVSEVDGPIIVYSGFEKSVLNDLKAVLPRAHNRTIDTIQKRLVDLLAIVRQHVYHPGFAYSLSIKSVGPALAPHVGYDDLGIVANGLAASDAFVRIAAGIMGPDEDAASLRAALLRYCERDTLAMVEVHRALRAMVHA